MENEGQEEFELPLFDLASIPYATNHSRITISLVTAVLGMYIR